MSMDKINTLWVQQAQNNTPFQQETWVFRDAVNTLIETPQKIITQELKDLEKTEKWFCVQAATLDAFFKKYPHISADEFREFFLQWTYNKNIFMCSAEIIENIDLDELQPWDDIIQYFIQKISISKEDFTDKVVKKINTLTFPNLAVWDVAQWYFFHKLKWLLPESEIIFWDMPEIRENLWKNQFNCDSVWFIDLMWNGLFNTCLLKLLKTPPNQEKLEELNTLFSQIEKDIFIWWSTLNIPFELPDNFQGISLPKMPSTDKKIQLLRSGILANSMWYLNSAYYAEWTKGSFVLWSHNIAEPIHAGKLTVINNDPANRYNHNWLISYFWEKCQLLLYMEWTPKENQEKVNSFLEVSQEELKEKHKQFQELYISQIQPLIYGILYKFLRKNFPELVK